jgi:hypothetical protein
MRSRVLTTLFGARYPWSASSIDPRVVVSARHPPLAPRKRSKSSTTRQSGEELEKIAKSVYREILRECAFGKQRSLLSSTSSSSSTKKNTATTVTKGAIPFRVRALLANNLREAFRAAASGDSKTDIEVKKENEKIANLARTISIWTFCHRANQDSRSTEYIVLNNLVNYYDSRAKIYSRSSSKKVLRDRKALSSLETEFNTLCVKPLIEYIQRSASSSPNSSSSSSSSSSSYYRPPFVFDI